MEVKSLANGRRPPLPSYEQALLTRGSPVHIRTGSDPASGGNTYSDSYQLRVTHSSIGFSSTGQAGDGHTGVRSDTGRPPVAHTRTAHHAQDVRTLRTRSSLGFGDAVQHQRRNRAAQPPRKPARKFPPIFENSRARHYGSDGFFDTARSDLAASQWSRDLESSRTGKGSSPSVAYYGVLSARSRNSCGSLGDDQKLFHATSEDLLHYRHILNNSTKCGSPLLRKPSSSTESLPLPTEPKTLTGQAQTGQPKTGQPKTGQPKADQQQHQQRISYQPLRPASATMAPPTTTARIRTNGSLHQLLQMQAEQQRQTPTYNDLLPAEKVNLHHDRHHGDHTDNVSVSSINSSTGSGSSDSGKATSHNSGDPQQEDALFMDDFHFGVMSHGKGPDTWKMLPDCGRMPWNQSDIEKVLQSALHEGKCFSPDILPFLTHTLRYPFIRVCQEMSRMTHSNNSRCTKRDVLFAAQRVLPFSLFFSGKTACLQAGAFYAFSLSQDQTRNSKSLHSGLKLDVGKVHGWMVERKIAKFVHDLSAVYMTALLQNILQEFISACGKMTLEKEALTSCCLERKLLDDAQFFPLFQPWRHLQAGKNGGNKAVLPLTLPVREVGKVLATGFRSMEDLKCAVADVCAVLEDSRKDRVRAKGGLQELTIYQMHWTSDAFMALFFFLGPDSTVLDCADKDGAVAPLIEWLRVIEACASYRRSSMCEKEDVMETARILLPSVDYPPHILSLNDELQYFQAITKPRLLNDFNQAGLTPLMIASMRGEYQQVRTLLAAGAKVNLTVPSIPSPNKHSMIQSYTRIQPDTQHWTALHFAVSQNSLMTVKCLLDGNAAVEGADTPTTVLSETPLQIAAAFGHDDILNLLLSKGADPWLSTVTRQMSCQKATPSAVVLAAAHGRSSSLSRLLSATSSSSSRVTSPFSPLSHDVSLVEMLQEAGGKTLRCEDGRRASRMLSPNGHNAASPFSKDQLWLLQNALYHAAENGFLDVIVELCYYSVPWKVYTWTRTVALLKPCHTSVLGGIIAGYWTLSTDELIESPAFISSTLPVFFDLLASTHHSNRPLYLRLLKILSHIYGTEPVPVVPLPTPSPSPLPLPLPVPLDSSAPLPVAQNEGPGAVVVRKTHLRLNDEKTADVVWRVEGVLVYAHKEVLNVSAKLKEMAALSEERAPLDVFNASLKHFLLLMQYLYQGGWQNLNIYPPDIPELMSTAHYFALPALMRYCESIWSRALSINDVLSTFLHAKLFSATELGSYCDGVILQNLSHLAEMEDAALSKFLFGERDTASRLINVLSRRILLKRQILAKTTHVI